MLKIYGSMLCPDCVRCREDLDRAGVPYEFLDFGEALSNLKEFLVLRDGDPLFDAVREKGSIGIPCILREDGSITLQWDEFCHM
ncbi:MAG: glutaredoxin [Oscillospiraceae bacterium]|nr:glutaredoxin [Oscillospiraceae bacterium]